MSVPVTFDRRPAVDHGAPRRSGTDFGAAKANIDDIIRSTDAEDAIVGTAGDARVFGANIGLGAHSLRHKRRSNWCLRLYRRLEMTPLWTRTRSALRYAPMYISHV